MDLSTPLTRRPVSLVSGLSIRSPVFSRGDNQDARPHPPQADEIHAPAGNRHRCDDDEVARGHIPGGVRHDPSERRHAQEHRDEQQPWKAIEPAARRGQRSGFVIGRERHRNGWQRKLASQLLRELGIFAKEILHERTRLDAGFARQIDRPEVDNDGPGDVHDGSFADRAAFNFARARCTRTFTAAGVMPNATAIASWETCPRVAISSTERSASGNVRRAASTASSSLRATAADSGSGPASVKDHSAPSGTSGCLRVRSRYKLRVIMRRYAFTVPTRMRSRATHARENVSAARSSASDLFPDRYRANL